MHKHFQKRHAARAKSSTRIHTGRNATTYAAPSPIRKIVFAVIFSTIIIVIAAIICGIMFNTENLTKRRMENLATEYYEDYFYEESVWSMVKYEVDLDATMISKYEKYGFSKVTLRQLLLYDDGKNAELKDSFKAVCDINETYVKFFPVSPYGERDYRVEYNYACDF